MVVVGDGALFVRSTTMGVAISNDTFHSQDRESVTGARTDADRFGILELTGEVFLVDEKTGASHRIGSHGRRVWRLLRSGASLEEAASVLAAETGGNPAVVLDDTRRLVADLADAGIVAELTR